MRLDAAARHARGVAAQHGSGGQLSGAWGRSAQVGPDSFSVYLIPETLRVTTLGRVSEGDRLNVEIDAQTQAIVDTVERILPELIASRLAPDNAVV